MRHLLILVLLPALCLTSLAADPPSAPAPERAAQEIAALIRQLGDQNFEVRQAATERLLERPDAAPALRKALKSDDPEVARRAAAILEGQARRQGKQTLDRLAGFASRGEIDRSVELLVAHEHWADEEAAWRVLTDLAQNLIDRAEKEFGEPAVPPRLDFLPAGDLTRYLKLYRPRLQTNGRIPTAGDREIPQHKRDTQGRNYEPVWARAEEIEVNQCGSDFLVSAGAVRGIPEQGGRLGGCVVFAGGSVDVRKSSSTAGSVIVCDGDFTARNARGCLIIARGDVRCTQLAEGCRIIASGSVDVGDKAYEKSNQIKQNEAVPLGFVRWFDPEDLGVVVEGTEGGVRVTRAEEGKPFARAGLQKGDLVTALGGARAGAAETFRRLLRKATITGEEVPLAVRRDGQALELTVPLK